MNPFDEGDISYDDKLGTNRTNSRSNSDRPPARKTSLRDQQGVSTHITPQVHIQYNNSHFATQWLYIAVTCHVIQFAVLLSADGLKLSGGVFALLVFIVILVPGLLIYGRYLVTKKKSRGDRCTYTAPAHPDEETDTIPDMAIYVIALAAVLEGLALAVYSISVAGYQTEAVQNVVLQALRFASITLLCFHRILRPANRVDPMRTVMELEVVSVCWDALDGSTLFQLLDGAAASSSTLTPLSDSALSACRALMGFWYLSVGFRLSFMFFTHLSPDSYVYKNFYLSILPAPLELSNLPTVDRTLQAMRLRALVVLVMLFAEFYAMILRIILWSQGSLDVIQQEMTLKNIMFIISAYSAYTMWNSPNTRDWNSRDLGFGLKIPTREIQRTIMRWSFIVCYVIESALLSSFLMADDRSMAIWGLNSVVDMCLVLFFTTYCARCHVKSSHEQPHWIFPQKGFVIFPGKLVGITAGLLITSLFIGRIPAIYIMYEKNVPRPDPWTLDNATLVISLSVVTITTLGLYLSNCYMLFEKEFTIAPDNYYAIHDPTISMVCTSTMIEGCLDILSASTLVSLCTFGLPEDMNGAVQLFALLEIVNACQCFALQALLSGGHNDTPGDLVRWKARIRAARALIDFGCFILRLTLWIRYDAVSSVFLIKNLYNLLHSAALVERAMGIDKYNKTIVFMEYVPAYEWYGLTQEQWKNATSTSIIFQPQLSARKQQIEF